MTNKLKPGDFVKIVTNYIEGDVGFIKCERSDFCNPIDDVYDVYIYGTLIPLVFYRKWLHKIEFENGEQTKNQS